MRLLLLGYTVTQLGHPQPPCVNTASRSHTHTVVVAHRNTGNIDDAAITVRQHFHITPTDTFFWEKLNFRRRVRTIPPLVHFIGDGVGGSWGMVSWWVLGAIDNTPSQHQRASVWGTHLQHFWVTLLVLLVLLGVVMPRHIEGRGAAWRPKLTPSGWSFATAQLTLLVAPPRPDLSSRSKTHWMERTCCHTTHCMATEFVYSFGGVTKFCVSVMAQLSKAISSPTKQCPWV